MEEITVNLLQNKQVAFFGRVKVIENYGVFFNWSGSGFTFRFNGTSAKAFFLAGFEHDDISDKKNNAYIGVFIDDNPYATARFPLEHKSNWYALAEGLPKGEHTVRVIKQTEVGNGRAAVLKLSTDGNFSELPEQKSLKIEFIGDSITCGYGNICSNESPEFVTREEDFSQTYAAVTSYLLKAEYSCIAASGNGFYHDYGCQTHNLIPELYMYTDKMLDEHIGMRAEPWNFANDKCDIVVIKLGQNDAQFCSGADLTVEERTEALIQKRRSGFTEAAKRFLHKIAECRPDTPIIFIYESGMYLEKEIIEAGNAFSSVHLMKIEPKQSYEGVGANGHWSCRTHSRVAFGLAERISRILCLK